MSNLQMDYAMDADYIDKGTKLAQYWLNSR